MRPEKGGNPIMLRSVIPVASSLVLAAALVACSAPPVPEQLPFFEPGVKFSVAPADPGCSPQGNYRATISSDVPLAVAYKVEIQVGDEHKVFARSNDAAGSEQTGDWVGEGMLVVLRDRGTDMVLAALRAGPGNCVVPDAGAAESVDGG